MQLVGDKWVVVLTNDKSELYEAVLFEFYTLDLG